MQVWVIQWTDDGDWESMPELAVFESQQEAEDAFDAIVDEIMAFNNIELFEALSDYVAHEYIREGGDFARLTEVETQ